MFEYLFNEDYRTAKNQYLTMKAQKEKLENIKKDLTNDTFSVNAINKKIDYIYEDFTKAVLVPDVRMRIFTKLDALKELYQTADINLCSACGEIDSECALLENEMENAESTMSTIKNQNSGSW